ncbi:MAG: aminoglycoside phosphotransferase family protein [Patescibacteria group bacterium]
MSSPLTNPEALLAIFKHFLLNSPEYASQIKINRCSFERFGLGCIHDTYKVSAEMQPWSFVWNTFLLQRINGDYFRQPEILDCNYFLLCRAFSHYDRRHRLTAVRLKDGSSIYCDEDGHYWRLFEFIEGSYSVNVVANNYQAYEIARAYGDFLRAAAIIGVDEIGCAIPRFHDTSAHLGQLIECATFKHGSERVNECASEIDFFLKQTDLIYDLAQQTQKYLPQRVTHNDTGLDNVLLDQKSQAALCAVDWDTVMPGTSAIDFGDLFRSAVSLDPAFDLLGVFEALLRGYIAGAGGLLKHLEISCFLAASQLVSLELGIRFLVDYLRGDPVFRGYDGSSLRSCRKSIARFQLLRNHNHELNAVLNNILRA